jgi:hypothetical protein
MSRQWSGRLAHYRRHQNDEHLNALVEEAVRYSGLHLENDLSASEYWSKAPLARRLAVLLYLVDRSIVNREVLKGRIVYVPVETAEAWVRAQTSLASYQLPTLELMAALRSEHARRNRHVENR